MAALGYLGLGPVEHKELKLSKDGVEGLFLDEWDERLDSVSRGMLGLTVACARCHDHKFDPISKTDYYALAGVFASTQPAVRLLSREDPSALTYIQHAPVARFTQTLLATNEEIFWP